MDVVKGTSIGGLLGREEVADLAETYELNIAPHHLQWPPSARSRASTSALGVERADH